LPLQQPQQQSNIIGELKSMPYICRIYHTTNIQMHLAAGKYQETTMQKMLQPSTVNYNKFLENSELENGAK
jgi:hypothetical protein